MNTRESRERDATKESPILPFPRISEPPPRCTYQGNVPMLIKVQIYNDLASPVENTVDYEI